METVEESAVPRKKRKKTAVEFSAQAIDWDLAEGKCIHLPGQRKGSVRELKNLFCFCFPIPFPFFFKHKYIIGNHAYSSFGRNNAKFEDLKVGDRILVKCSARAWFKDETGKRKSKSCPIKATIEKSKYIVHVFDKNETDILTFFYFCLVDEDNFKVLAPYPAKLHATKGHNEGNHTRNSLSLTGKATLESTLAISKLREKSAALIENYDLDLGHRSRKIWNGLRKNLPEKHYRHVDVVNKFSQFCCI